jgi:hypothetical protein
MAACPSLINHVALLRDVETVQELPDILVPHPANLLDVRSALRDSLERVTEKDQLILLVLRDLSLDTGLHHDIPDDLLADEVTDLDLPVASLGVLVQVDVDGKMGVDVAHLVLEPLGHASDEVVDDGPDGTEGGNVLADAMVDLDANQVLLGGREADGDVAQVLDELAAGALDRNEPRLNRDLDCRRSNGSATSHFAIALKPPRVFPPEKPSPNAYLHPSRYTLVGVGRRSRVTAAVFLSMSSCCTPGFKLANVPFSGTSRVSSLWM